MPDDAAAAGAYSRAAADRVAAPRHVPTGRDAAEGWPSAAAGGSVCHTYAEWSSTALGAGRNEGFCASCDISSALAWKLRTHLSHPGCWYPGPCLNIKTVFPGMGIPMLKIRQSWDCLTFNMGIPILVGWQLYIEMAPWFLVFPGQQQSYCFVIRGPAVVVLTWFSWNIQDMVSKGLNLLLHLPAAYESSDETLL